MSEIHSGYDVNDVIDILPDFDRRVLVNRAIDKITGLDQLLPILENMRIADRFDVALWFPQFIIDPDTLRLALCRLPLDRHAAFQAQFSQIELKIPVQTYDLKNVNDHAGELVMDVAASVCATPYSMGPKFS